MPVPLNMAIQLQGVDATADAFNSVAARAKRVGAKVADGLKMATVAAAGVSAAVGVAAKAALNQMNELNDTAQRAGVSAEWLQRFSGAMGQAGILMQQSDIVGSIQKLNAGLVNTEKITALQKLGVDVEHLKGLKPEEAFMGFLDVVSKIPDEQTRLLALMRGMEEQGLKLAPLMRQGPDAFSESLRAVMDIIPAVSDGTVTVATNANNAFALVAQSFQTIWHEVLGDILVWGDEAFGGLDKAIMRTWEYVKFFTLTIVRAFQTWGEAVGGIIALFQFDFCDALKVTFLRLGQFGRLLLSPFIELAKFLGDDEWKSSVDSFMEYYDGSVQNAINMVYDQYGFSHTTSLADKVKADFDEMQANVKKWETGLSAKSKLSTGATEIGELPIQEIPKVIETPIQESVKKSVSSGVQQGLAEGVESSSYTVLKNAFKAASLTKSTQQVAAAVAGAMAGPAAPVATSGTAQASATSNFQREVITILSRIFDSSDKSQKALAALGAF